MKTPTSVTKANSAETGDNFSVLVTYSDGSSEILKKSEINARAGEFAQNLIDKAVARKEMYRAVKELADEVE